MKTGKGLSQHTSGKMERGWGWLTDQAEQRAAGLHWLRKGFRAKGAESAKESPGEAPGLELVVKWGREENEN